MSKRRGATSTTTFGVGRRESHDATEFYSRFSAPSICDSEEVCSPSIVDEIFVGDARRMDKVDDSSVALVVTSPPYFTGKEYEQALGKSGVPATYLEYLEVLTDVLAECVTKLEMGGRMAVNVANLGRKPYRSLSADVISILQDRLRLLLRAEIVWVKARGSAGSCAWGSFQSPVNPVVRDLTERVIVASKGRFDRALPPLTRESMGLPFRSTVSRDEFMDATTDVWEIAPESASRVGHPAPFPVQLPQRIIELYTFAGDLVLDPFMGSGTTAVAALRSRRHFVGYDTDPKYVEHARRRLARESREVLDRQPPRWTSAAFEQALSQGASFKELAVRLLESKGYRNLATAVPIAKSIAVDLRGYDSRGRPWNFDLSGAVTTLSSGFGRSDAVWRALGRAAVIRQIQPAVPVVVLTSGAPKAGSPGAEAIRAAVPSIVTDVIQMLCPEDQARLGRCPYS